MAVDSRGAQGQPVFSATGADDQAADLTTLGEYALERGGLLRGTTAQRDAFTTANRAREGDHWYDTTLDVLMVYTGTGWKRTKAAVGFTLSGSTWLNGGGILGGGTYVTIRSTGGTIDTRKLKPSVPGLWRFTLCGVWAENNTGLRSVALSKNGLTAGAAGAAGNYAGDIRAAMGRTEFSVSLTCEMNGTTDVAELNLYQTSGTTLTATWLSLTGELID